MSNIFKTKGVTYLKISCLRGGKLVHEEYITLPEPLFTCPDAQLDNFAAEITNSVRTAIQEAG